MKKLIAISILTLIASATQSQGYDNPIDDQNTETVTNLWDLVSDHLYVGSNTWGNAMIVTNEGSVQNFDGIIGYESNAVNNAVLITGSNSGWTSSHYLSVGNYGAGNTLTVLDGGRAQCFEGYIGYWCPAVSPWSKSWSR